MNAPTLAEIEAIVKPFGWSAIEIDLSDGRALLCPVAPCPAPRDIVVAVMELASLSPLVPRNVGVDDVIIVNCDVSDI